MKEMTQVGRWIFVGLLAIAIGISGYFADRNWDGGPGNGHSRSEVVTTVDGQTIVIERDRHFFPGFIFIPFLIFGLFWAFGPRRYRANGARGGGPGPIQYAEWERW